MRSGNEDMDKVTAFVTRETGGGRELLVFRHPTGGVQLPAGTVEPGEDIETALLRETQEETSLTEVAIVAKLATLPEALEPDRRMLLAPVVFRADPREDAPIRDIPFGEGRVVQQLGRGITVRVLEVQPPYARVAYTLYDFRDNALVVDVVTEGWIPADALADRVHRHLFHLRTLADTPDRWVCNSDGGHDFFLYWVPLAQNPGLLPWQEAWLRQVIDALQH